MAGTAARCEDRRLDLQTFTYGRADIDMNMIGLAQDIANQMIGSPFFMYVRIVFQLVENCFRIVIEQLAIHQC